MRNPNTNDKVQRRIVGISCAIALLSLPTFGGDQDAAIDTKLAAMYFHEARAMCEADAGKLWGVDLSGPMMFVDPQSRAIVASQADQEGLLREQNGVYIGQLPPEQGIANTVTQWAGIKWAMIIWPLSEDQRTRGRLMTHELWHRVEHALLEPVPKDAGVPSSEAANGHLDTRDGRTFLQLEWRALEAALQDKDPDRRTAVKDALVFRAYRRSLFPNAASEEQPLEMSEGLAEYTGIKLSTKSNREAIADATAGLHAGTQKDTFVRSFAYASGPPYGLLLDGVVPDWRTELSATTDLGVLTRAAYSIVLPTDLKEEAERRTERYDGKQLMAEEAKRDAARRKRLARDRARFVEGPVLVLSLTSPSVQFNPGNLQPLGDLGTVYPTMTLSDVWGFLTVTEGALLKPDWSEVRVVAPKDLTARPITGDGWTLKLKENWRLQPGKRTGDYVLGRRRDD